jgi:hypothetical protein
MPNVRQIELELPRPGHRPSTLFIEINSGALSLELSEDSARWGMVLPMDSLIRLLKEHGRKKV